MSPARRQNPEEQAFLAAYDVSAFERPSVTVDVVLLTAHEGRLRAVLLRREEHPHKGAWALPGGFVQMHESLEQAVDRVLEAKAGLAGIFTEQLYTFGAPDRDPRTRVIAVTYYALVDHGQLRAARDGSADHVLATVDVPWQGLEGGAVHALDDEGNRLPLAFDHAHMLGTAVMRLRGKLDYAPIGFELLPEQFTLRQLQAVHETVLGKRVNKDSFRRRMRTAGLIEPTGERERDVLHRPAALFRFSRPTRA